MTQINTYQLRSESGNQIITAAIHHLVRALKASETQLGRRVSNVELEYPIEGEIFRLTLARLDNSLVEGAMEASGGVQSGGSSASPGAVPAATTLPKNLRSTRKVKRATPR